MIIKKFNSGRTGRHSMYFYKSLLYLSIINCIALFTAMQAVEVSQACCSIISHECLDRQEVYGTTTTIFHGSAVEPTIAVNPKNKKNIVAVWQQDRISNGGALEAGISYSKDGGKHWHKSKIPLQICAGGIIQRSGDEWLSYSADGSRVYLCAAVLNATQEPNTQNQFGVVVTISEDDGAYMV